MYSFATDGWFDFATPLRSEHRYRADSDAGNVRFLGLSMIANNFATANSADETPHLLFKDHPEWGFVLPSVTQQPGQTLDQVTTAVSDWVRDRFDTRTAPSSAPFGCVVSFKHSPTNGESGPYIFPLIAIRAAVPKNQPQRRFDRGGRSWEYLDKYRLGSDDLLHNGANADVYRALERIDSSWLHIERLGYEFDLAISFAGEQRSEVEQLTQALRQLRPDLAIFLDQDMNMTGADMDTLLPYVYREGSRRAIVCASAGYRGRQWTGVEYRNLLTAARRRRGGTFLIPVSMDGSRDMAEFDGMYFLPYNELGPEDAAKEIAEIL